MIIPRQCRGIFSSCFHSSCFPSEWEVFAFGTYAQMSLVSIQVVFPASGKPYPRVRCSSSTNCFHSSCFPSEWEVADNRKQLCGSEKKGFHSSCFPSEWEADYYRRRKHKWQLFPFKLFSQRVGRTASSSVMLIN